MVLLETQTLGLVKIAGNWLDSPTGGFFLGTFSELSVYWQPRNGALQLAGSLLLALCSKRHVSSSELRYRSVGGVNARRALIGGPPYCPAPLGPFNCTLPFSVFM